MAEKIIEFDAMEQAVSLFGSFDENVKMIEGEYDVSIISRGSELKVCGDIENVDKAVRALNSMLMLINKGEQLTQQNVRYPQRRERPVRTQGAPVCVQDGHHQELSLLLLHAVRPESQSTKASRL